MKAATRIAVLGAAGQVGLALMKRLHSGRWSPGAPAAESRWEVVGICRSRLSATRVAWAGATVLVPPSSAPAVVARTLSEFDLVVNCALPNQGPSRNRLQAEELAQSLAGVGSETAVLHLSSVAVYGKCFVAGRTRFERPCPEDRYGREKLAMERQLWRLSRRRSGRVWIGRLGHVYGPELNWSKILFGLLADTDFRIPFAGAKPSNAISIDNLAAAVEHLAFTRPASATFNLVDCPQRTWREIADFHGCAIGSAPAASLSARESAALCAQFGSCCGRGLAGRLGLDIARWMGGLPASFIAQSPALQELAEIVLARAQSEQLESRLKALYWRAVARSRCPAAPLPGPLGCLVSDAVPGPALEYAPRNTDPIPLAEYQRLLSEPLV